MITIEKMDDTIADTILIEIKQAIQLTPDEFAALSGKKLGNCWSISERSYTLKLEWRNEKYLMRF